MQDEKEDNIQFKMRSDGDIEEAVIPNQVDDLRIEKLNHRMTLISILIPVLIVVILGVAYLDIKRRVVRTEDSGQMTAQNLSEDLQSRFSSLSLGQAMIEENFARLKDQSEQSMAKVQVNLSKLDDMLQQSSKTMVSRSDMKTTAARMEKNIESLSQSIKTLDAQLQTLDQYMRQELQQLAQNLAGSSAQIAGLTEKLNELNTTKIDKATLDLALKLETLKQKQVFNSRIDATQSKTDDLQSKLKALELQVLSLKRAQTLLPVGPPLNAVPTPSKPSSSGSLEEQTIK